MKDIKELRIIWQQRIAEYKKSGLTQRNWCMENNIPYDQLKYWLYKHNSQQTAKTYETSWVPVRVSSVSSNLTNSRLVVKMGMASVEVQSGFDKHLLADLLKVLKESC
jgi:hypothetical protein